MNDLMDLEKMSREQLILMIYELRKEILDKAESRKSKAGVVLVGSPRMVRDFAELQRKLIAEEQGDK